MSIKTLFAAGKVKIYAMSAAAIIGASALVFYFTAKSAGGSGFNPAFKAYVSAYTGGVISRESPILIKFVSEVAKPEQINVPVEKSLFDFTPSVKGTTTWIDKNTIQFQPEEPLAPGTSFKANFEIGEVLTMPDDLQEFNFEFQTIPQTVEVTVEGLRTYDVHNLKLEKLQGILSTADVADNTEVEKVLSATQDNKSLRITWTHDEDRRTHYFQVDSIVRKDKKGKVDLSWDGSFILSESKGNTTYEVPALGDFILVSARAVQGEEQYLEVQFSDPLLPGQDLTGLITIKDVPDLRIVLDENIVKAYPPVRQIGVKTVTLNQGIKNINGKRFPKTQILDVTFEEIKPSVRLTGKGVILPSTDGLVFPFEAVSLRSVEVKVLKIYENNITQFFQVNNFDGTYELQRVGKVVLKKTVSLNNTSLNDYAKWKRYSIDLSSLINAEPGAIYQVKIGFNKKDIYYACDNTSEVTSGLIENESEEEDYEAEEQSSWSYYEDYYYSEDYNYEDKDNPCSDSYYGDYRSVKRNIFASDLGVIAKIGTSGNMTFAITDLKTTQPVEGAKVEIYDYQQQLLKSENTNGEGLASIELKKKPFFLMVKKDKQVAYLKLDNNSALSISNFDVSGAKVQKGIKGFLYGERGVWRPGDSLFLTFILEDKSNARPHNQPGAGARGGGGGGGGGGLVVNQPVEGFYSFNTATSQEDPTGNWTAKVKVGGADFSYPIKVETIMPNRLKIKIDFGDKITAENKSIKGNLDVKWLHGATAKNLDADISMQLLKSETKFEKYTDYTFDDPGRIFESEEMSVFKGQIDENGHANVNATVNAAGTAPGVLSANFKIKVFEEGGAFSTDRFSVPYYPYSTYTGIRLPKGDKARNMLLTDTNHVVDVVSVDANGKPVSGRKIEMRIYQVNWRWWWDKSDDDLAAFLDNSYRSSVIVDTITTVNGKGKWTFRINYPSWGRYYVRAYDLESKHSTGKTLYIDWPGWAGKSREKNQGGATVLAFTTDKEKYNVGEDITLSIPGAANGRALVSLESGSKVVQTFWVETKEGNTPFTFKATEDMSPNVFVNITLIQPHAQTKNDLPIRMYGIMPVKVENPETFLKPVISMKDELRPEESVSVSVKEQSGKEMTYTIAVVDEGLLDLTRFKTPDPWNHFYAREALGVNTWDMYDYVIGAYGEKMDKLLAIGGDAEVKGSEKNKANRFKPVVIFLGPFKLEAGKSATHTFKMPQYVGSVRTMVVAGNRNGAYGNAEKTTPVRKPLMLLATLPRVVGPDEYVALPVNIFAMTKNVKNVNVQVKTNGMFEAVEESQKSITFSEPGDEIVNFYLKVKSATGLGKVTVSAWSGSEKASAEISIDVRNPNPTQTKVTEILIQPGQEWNAEYEPFGTAGTNQGILEVSTIPPINLGERLKWLIQYPYGCVEQTTSSVFPQLYVKDFVQSSETVAKKTETNVKAGIDRLRTFQQADGGMSYWPGTDEVNSWGTTYSGHFMIEAEKKGYALPPGFKAQWIKYQKKAAKNWDDHSHYGDLDQAYRLYTLALAGDAETGAMNRLRERKNLSVSAKWRLAAAYQMIGQSDVAKSLINGLNANIPKYNEMDGTFGSDVRDKAMILEVMCLMNMKTQAVPVLKEISADLSGKRWMCTQEIAYSLLAVSRYANSTAAANKINFTYTNNNEKSINAVTDMKISQVDLNVKESKGMVKVKNNSTGPLYARVILTGTPSAGNEVETANNPKVNVNYKAMDGSDINIFKMEQGTDFMVEVSITNPGMRGAYKNLSLKQIFASGWEIHNARMDNSDQMIKPKTKRSYYNYDLDYEENNEDYVDGSDKEDEKTQTVNLSIPTYRDIRDDRVYTFFDLNAYQTKTFRVMLNSSYLGKFYLPAVYVEAMYDGTINATVPGQWVEVVQMGGDAVSVVTE
ncbi:MAG: hypothetical protein K2X86_06985 [Cytophagaceae bacterium]|nr:hypothetical protein [Cytophagaceae bacterium]